MAKSKQSKASGNIPNKSLHCRVSYLYQAAAYLATQQRHSGAVAHGTGVQSTATTTDSQNASSELYFDPVSRRLVSDLCSVTLKAQIRMSPAIKHSICKHCDTLLLDGSTCSNEVENKSKGGKKPWADILVRKCDTCGFTKRFPLAAERQMRRPLRGPDHKIVQGSKV